MWIAYLKPVAVAMALLLAAAVQADIYRWIDDDGQVHFGQQAPQDRPAERIDTPPPPPISSPAPADTTPAINDDTTDTDVESDGISEQEFEQQQQAIREQNCRIARQNLEIYQNNPGRRFLDEDGNVDRLSEEDRQARILEMQELIEEFCEP